jgi:hypothetical protein
MTCSHTIWQMREFALMATKMRWPAVPPCQVLANDSRTGETGEAGQPSGTGESCEVRMRQTAR